MPRPDAPEPPRGPALTGVARLGVASGPAGLRAAVAAFAAGHTAVLLVAPGAAPDAALLALADAELAAPLTAVIGPAAGGGIAVLGLSEIVPALLALDAARPDAAAEALRLAVEAGLSPVVLPASPGASPGQASPGQASPGQASPQA